MADLKRVKFLLADGVVRAAGGGRVGLPTGVLKINAKEQILVIKYKLNYS